VVFGDSGELILTAGIVTEMQAIDVDGLAAGDDVIATGAGDDWIIAGVGDDDVTAGADSDILFGDGGELIFEDHLGHRRRHRIRRFR
jgi:Ca2+-binding RTX toxin-like protein